MVGMTLTLNASRYSDDLAIVFRSARLTYGKLNARACQLANALAGIGLRKGDRVAALLYNCHQFIETFFAAAKIGAIFVPVNFRLSKPEIDELLADCAAAVLIYGGEFAETVGSLAHATHFPEKVVHVGAPGEHASSFDTGPEYDSWIAGHQAREPRVEVACADDQLIVYSSGTTGRPKGAVWTHANTLCSSMAKIIDFQLTPKDTTVVFGPLFHVGPLIGPRRTGAFARREAGARSLSGVRSGSPARHDRGRGRIQRCLKKSTSVQGIRLARWRNRRRPRIWQCRPTARGLGLALPTGFAMNSG